MTNEELISKIKAEIERQEKQCPLDTYEGRHKLFILGYFKTFLDTLKSENPTNQDGLEKEIENAWKNLEKDYSPSALDKTRILVSGLVGEKQFSKIAHHFAQLGAEHAKEELMKESVEGVLVDNADGTQEICLHGNRYGDKVRVIILPKEG